MLKIAVSRGVLGCAAISQDERDLPTREASYARRMRKLPLTTLCLGIAFAAQPTPARADVGLGLFLGDPTGLDLKIGLSNRSGLDFVLGYDTYRDGRAGYGHLTYLVTPLVGHGTSVLVPLRIGIGAAILGPGNDLTAAIRAPLELGLRLRSAPLEFYGELALALVFRDTDLHLQGGLGFRVFF